MIGSTIVTILLAIAERKQSEVTYSIILISGELVTSNVCVWQHSSPAGSVVNLAPQSLVATLLLRGCPHTVTSPGSASRKAACARELLTPQLTPVVPVSPEFTLALYIA